MHNGMLTVGGAKMAKSEGNSSVRGARWAPGEVIRLLCWARITATRSIGRLKSYVRRVRASTGSTER
jgi:cysteinyl-tRNA synthetase